MEDPRHVLDSSESYLQGYIGFMCKRLQNISWHYADEDFSFREPGQERHIPGTS